MPAYPTLVTYTCPHCGHDEEVEFTTTTPDPEVPCDCDEQ